MELIKGFLFSAASAAVTSGLLMWLFKDWLSTKLRARIQHEYDRKLEVLKADLRTQQEIDLLNIKTAVAREAAFHAAAHASFAEGQKAAMERKLGAVDRVWSSVLQIRSNLPPALALMDVMTVDEYRVAKDYPDFRALTTELTPEKLTELAPKSVEEVRPYVGEYLWAVFFSYQTILIRILLLLHLGRTDAQKIEWYKDTGTRNLIETVLTAAELSTFDQTRFRKAYWLQQRLEEKILTAAQKVISGETFGAESLQQAAAIQQRISLLSKESPTSSE